MTTHEVEQILGLSKQTLIYYEKEGFIEPSRDNNNYRNYSNKDIEVLKYIQLLRSMDLPIDDIKMIVNGELSLRVALENRKAYIEKQKLELDDIEKKIKDYIKRKKVKISFNDEKLETWKEYDTLFFNMDGIKYNDDIIVFDNIKIIDISMCSYVALGGPRGFNMQYYIDLDIHCLNDYYSFQIMNNNKVLDMFNYLDSYSLTLHDPLNLKQLYHDITDPVELNSYLNRHFKDWAKEYRLDNPRNNNISDSFKKSYEESQKTIQLSKNIFKNFFGKK